MAPCPKLRPDIESSHLNESGGEHNIVLRDPVSEKFFRLSEWEYALLKTLDGTLEVEEAVDFLKSQGHHYSLDDAQLIVGKAAQAGLLLGTGFGTAKYQTELSNRIASSKKSRRLASLYFMFIPVLNPDPFLDKTLWVYRGLFNRWTISMLTVLAPGAIYIGIAAAVSREEEFLFFFNFYNLLLLWVTLALTKLFHELAHAYTAKSYGLRVPQMGVAFLVFFPCLYCDTTQAWRLANKKERISISFAGIVAEASLAILSAYVWYFSRPGLINSLAFYLMAVSFVSTVLFNANPLMRYDGYYILSDYLGVTNLASKSLGFIKYLFLNRVLGITGAQNPAGSFRETFIFVIYGFSAFLYRVFLYSAIVIGVYLRFNKLLGFILAMMGLYVLAITPMLRGVGNLYSQRSQIILNPKGSLILCSILLLTVFCLFKPLSSKTVYPCYLDSGNSQKITVPLQAPISRISMRDGQTVEKDAGLFELDPTLLQLGLFEKRMDCMIKKAQVELLLLDDKEMSKVAEKQVECEQLEHEAQLMESDLKLAKDGIVSPFSGIVTRLDYRAQRGFGPGKGAIIGDIKTNTEAIIKILVPESDRIKVFQGQAVHVFFPVRSGIKRTDRIYDIRPYSEKDLRNSPFSSRFGGEIATESITENVRDVPLDAQYVCQVPFENTEGLPIGLAGRCAVESMPQSLVERFVTVMVKAFNRETLI